MMSFATYPEPGSEGAGNLMDLHRFLDAPLLLDERAAARLLLKVTHGLKGDDDGGRRRIADIV